MTIAAGESPEISLPSPLDSVEDMRTTAKWMLAAIGAVGAVLISGGPLVAIGQVHGTAHTVRALIGLVLALAGVGVAIWFTSQVLMPRLTTPATILDSGALTTLLDRINAEPAEFMGVTANSVQGLFARQGNLRRKAVTLSLQLASAPQDQALHDQLAAAVAQEENVARQVRWVLALGHAWLVRRDLAWSRIATMAGGLLVIAGAVLFFSATSSSSPTYVPVLTPSPAATATR